MMRNRLLVLAAAALALLAGVAIQHSTTSAAAVPQTAAANAAVVYIKGLQNSDGGFPAFGSDSTPGSTLDAAFALIAAGADPEGVTNSGSSPVDYLSARAATYAADPGGAAKLALGVSAIGLDASSFSGLDLWSMLAANMNATTGAYGNNLFVEALYVLALERAGRPVPAVTRDHLKAAQASDGGWEFQPGAGSDSNTTAMVIQALIGAGASSSDGAIANGVAYLHTVQNGDGGFAFVVGSDSDPNSTALVIQALVATDQDIDAGGPWDRGGHTPMDALLSYRDSTTGALQFSGADSPFATYQGVPALMLAPFPELRTRVLIIEATPTTPAATSTPPRTVDHPATPTRSAVLPNTGGATRHDGRQLMPIWALLGAASVTIGGFLIGKRAR